MTTIYKYENLTKSIFLENMETIEVVELGESESGKWAVVAVGASGQHSLFQFNRRNSESPFEDATKYHQAIIERVASGAVGPTTIITADDITKIVEANNEKFEWPS